VLWLVFLNLWVTFFLLEGGALGMGTGSLGGYLGIVCGLTALYVSFTEVTNGQFRRMVVPLGSPIVKS
jgi:succinate-acetate transporter protein